MFEEWKRAWQDAVANFQRELAGDDDAGTPAQVAAMRQDLQAARAALDRLRRELEHCEQELHEEAEQERQCRRRSELAARIADAETVRVAETWAERHAQRAAILRKKAEVLSAELAMRQDDLATMQAQLRQVQEAIGIYTNAPPTATPHAERAKQDAEFRRLEQEAREKLAQERLEELKRRMQ